MSGDLARLRWRARRGMRELDAVLQAFLDRSGAELSEADKQRFEALLDLPDPELYDYLVRHDEPDDGELARFVRRVRASLGS